jgi:hypothetical protein
MSYQDALADLKEEFGKKKLLTPADIAPYIDRSASAQASMRTRKQFPIAKKDLGGRVVVSIYALARFIGEDGDVIADTKPAPAAKAAKASSKSASGIDKTKPIRRPPSLGRTLTMLRARVEHAALQLKFQQTLYAELEAVAMDKVAKTGRKVKRLTIDD